MALLFKAPAAPGIYTRVLSVVRVCDAASTALGLASRALEITAELAVIGS
jgi:hypothetical protein